MPAKTPLEREQLIINAYLAGATLEEVASLFSYSISTISLILKRNNIKSRDTKISVEQEQAIINAYLKGSTPKEIAAFFGYSTSACLKVLHRNGINVRSQKLSPEQEQTIIDTYLAGASAKQVAIRLGHAEGTCLRVLQRNGIARRTQEIPQQHQDAMVSAYLAGATLEQAAKPFGYSPDACYEALHRRGLSARSVAESQRHYSVNESFFDEIDSEAKAYWLGFITADGAINYKNGQLRILLKSDDRKHLEKFAKDIQSEHQIVSVERNQNGKLHTYTSITIISMRLIKALETLGVTQNKSFTVKPCINVPENLQAHYWRGLVDGDGSIGYYTSSKSKYRLYLCGNYFIVNGFRDYISHFVTSTAAVKPHGSIYAIEYAGTNLTAKVARLLYEDATVYLERKYQIAQRLFAEKV